jgi:hypothetical protein
LHCSIFPRQVLETMTAAAIRSAVADEEAAARLPVDRHPALLAPQNTTFAMQHEQVGWDMMVLHCEHYKEQTLPRRTVSKWE